MADRPIQRTEATMRLGQHAEFAARVEVTSTGLLAIAALVSSILLSSAVLVRVSVREGGRARALRHHESQ